MSHKLPVHNFEWIKDTSQFNKDFIENYNEESDEEYFLEADDRYFWKLQVTLKITLLHNGLQFL